MSLIAPPGTSAETALGVATFLEAAKEIIEGAFEPLWLRGEVTKFTAHRNGHWYFTVKDGDSALECIVWSRDQARIPAAPKAGDQLIVYGRVDFYPVRSQFRLVVTKMEAEGDGLWKRRFEQARVRLEADGLLAPERKRPLPLLPRCVAVVTSPDGAVLHDIVTVIRRRAPQVAIAVAATRVQGEGAIEEIVAALARVDRWGGADVVILGRGGGSREDLQPFNEEAVARAVAACRVPTISAVGHETDVTLCDLVADRRAPTPSAAAEMAVPDVALLRVALAQQAARLRTALERRAALMRERLTRTTREMRASMARGLERRRERAGAAGGRLHALSPLATLERGYAVARDVDSRRPIRSVRALPRGTRFELVLHDGTARAVSDGTPSAGG